MSRIIKSGQMVPSNRLAALKRTRKRAPRQERKLSSLRCCLRVEQLETRVTPSINPAAPLELDGNVITTTAHDWDQVFANTSGALAASFVTDAVNTTQDDIFTGGGSKDTLGIQQGRWLFTDSKPQAKDDITHAYAAAYTDPSNGHLLLYAGLDRFDDSGDATAGFWFFQNPIAENPNVTTNGGHPFTGTHADGDVLLVSDFTTGGSVSTIKVFRWTGNDSTGSLVALNNGNPINGNTFAIVNGAAISVPWSYTNKSGSSSPAAGEFLEEGVDLTALGLSGCFSAFLAETRSSQSPTATLSDFVVGNFPLCSIAAPQFAGLSKVGDSFTYPLTVENTGAQPLYLRNVTDTLLGNIVVNGVVQAPVAPVTSIDASALAANTPLAPGASITIFVTRTVQATDPDPTPNTVTFVFNDKANFSGNVIQTSVSDSVNLFQPSATLTVTASPTTAQHLGDPITYTFIVTNTSSLDSPNLVLSTSNPNNSFTDTLLGNLEADAIAAGGGSVAPGASFTFTETRAIQAGDPSPLTNTTTVVFTLAQNLGNFGNQISAGASTSVTLLSHLAITKTVTGDGTSAVIHPGDTASFTITVTDDGAGPASHVVVTDQLPEPDLLTWAVASSSFDTASLSAGDFLTASKSSLAAGASISVTVSAVVPADIFGPPPGSIGNGDPLPSGLFELDGNAFDDPAVAGDDWSNAVFGNGGSSTAHSFVTDAINSKSDDIFTGGGSKDTLGIQQGAWLFTGSKPQAKDDISHAYAALYTDPTTGDQILYAGLDRFDNSGDATAGFWFFQNPIGENPNVTTNGGHPFTGTHLDGDILLVSDFTTGGSVSTIKVFKWVGDDSTGSLVALNSGNPIGGSTFAIVNGAPISLPWSFVNKSHETTAAAGEFLEEGVNLTALGLNACFSSFLAETRSSQSPTATLSDFVVGNFNTCMLQLPNTATVQADGIAPITSNQMLITVLPAGGMPQLPTAPGIGAGTAVLTDQTLQLAVVQAIDQWRAAGVEPQKLAALEHVPIHVADITWGWLGLTAQGQVWIDRTAAGWGWSTDATPAPGRMDLLTVVTHEFGHVLGLAPTATGVMEVTLAPGIRQVPAAADSVMATAALADRARDSAAATVRGTPASGARTEASVASLIAAARTQVALPVAAAALQDGASGQRSLPGVVLNLGYPILPSATTVPATVLAGADQDWANALAPSLWPPRTRAESGSREAAVPNDKEADEVPAKQPADMLVDPQAESQVGVLLRQRAGDACFADGSWMTNPAEDSGPSLAAAVASLGVLGGQWGAERPKSEPRRRRGFQI